MKHRENLNTFEEDFDNSLKMKDSTGGVRTANEVPNCKTDENNK